MYHKHSLKLLAYNDEVERLAYLVGVLATCGYASHSNFQTASVGKGQHRGNTSNTMKVTVKLTKTPLFDKQYLQPDSYGIVKNGLMQKGVAIAEKMFLLDSQTLFK